MSSELLVSYLNVLSAVIATVMALVPVVGLAWIARVMWKGDA